MKKSILLALVAFFTAFCIASCGSDSKGPNTPPTPPAPTPGKEPIEDVYLKLENKFIQNGETFALEMKAKASDFSDDEYEMIPPIEAVSKKEATYVFSVKAENKFFGQWCFGGMCELIGNATNPVDIFEKNNVEMEKGQTEELAFHIALKKTTSLPYKNKFVISIKEKGKVLYSATMDLTVTK